MTHDFSQRTLSRKFVLQRRIGVGGMATVYEATNLQVDKRIAVKVLNPEFVTHETLLIRFRQEARSAARLSHPHIVQIHDYDVDGELPYIVMEHLEGCSLSELLHQSAEPIPWRRVTNLCAQVAAALQYAHSRQILHRDIKPSNVFLVADPERDHIKLLDFGIAKVHQLDPEDPNPLTRPSQVPGTPEYMAPEQAVGQPCDPRTDIYALGVMMYRLLSGRLPFHAATPTETLTQHVLRAPTPLRSLVPDLDIPAELDAIVLKALAKQPDQRWESAQALREALLMLLEDGHPTQARAPRSPLATPTVGTRALDMSATPGWTTLHAFEWRDMLLRRRRLAAAFAGVSLGLGAFMFFSLFEMPFVEALARSPAPPKVERVRREPPSKEPEPLLPGAAMPTPPVQVATASVPKSSPPDDANGGLQPGDGAGGAGSGDLGAGASKGAGGSAGGQGPGGAGGGGNGTGGGAVIVRPPPPDPRRLIEGSLKRRRASFRECSGKIPFGESITLRFNIVLEPSTGRAISAEILGDLKDRSYSLCAATVLRNLKYPRYVGDERLDNLELKL